MSSRPLPEEVLAALVRRGLPDSEVFVKRGRSRRVERTTFTESSLTSQEKGWAVRAGHRRGSFFMAGTGDLDPDGPSAGWPEPAGRPIDLPEPVAVPAWNPPSDFDSPMIGESEGLKLLESLGRELASELPGARLLRAALEDGSSEGEIVNSRGLRARVRHRVASLYLEAAGPGKPAATATLYLCAREARRFHPPALARRLADRLAVQAAGAPPERDGGDVLLAPAVAVRLLAGILPLLVGPQSTAYLSGRRDRRGRIGSDLLTLVDNGRLAGGAFEAPVDGEGVPCREVMLIEEGQYRQPLLAWWQESAAPGTPSGCSRRASWRDLPAPGPTHLYLRPDARTPVAALLGAIDRGYYLIDATGAGRFDFGGDRFALPVCGFAVAGGRAAAPVAGAWLCGGISALLHGLRAVGRDLAFHPLDGMIGAPTLLVSGLELRAWV